MGKHTTLSREEYAKKFKDQMNRYNYIPQKGEIIMQAKPPYPDYWFVSNKGYIFTAYYKDLHILSDNPTEMGLKNKDGKRTNKKWRYVFDKKFIPAWKVFADHFCEYDFSGFEDEETEIHHIRKRSLFNADEGDLCNSADNLQILPHSVHKGLTTFSNKTAEEHEKNIKEKVEDPKLPRYAVDLESYLKILQKINPNGVISIMDGDKVKAYQMKDIKFF